MKILKLFLFSSIMILLLSSCRKSPVNSETENPIDLNEERLLIVRNTSSVDFSEICTIRPDSSGLQVISHYTYDKDTYYWLGYEMARWSPDKSKIVIAGGPGSTNEYVPLWLMDMNGRLLHKLTWNGNYPVWTHDGTRILFERRRGYFSLIWDVYSVNIDGTDERLVYQVGDSTIFYLSDVSASGEYILGYESIVYYTKEGKQSSTDLEIVKIHLDTGEKEYLTDNELSDGCPRYNGDETMIAYLCRDIPGETMNKNIRNVYVMSPDGSNKRRVTNETKPNSILPFMAWSPDGKKITFQKMDKTSEYDQDSDIFIVDIDTGELFQLTDTAKDGVTNLVMDWK